MTGNTDQTTLAYINMFGVLGGLIPLCNAVPEAKKILGKSSCAIGFSVKNGPEATFTFADGKCTVKEGMEGCTIKIPFRSPEHFNGMIDGTVLPIPTRGLTRIGFLLKRFTKLTDLLTAYLRPSPERMQDEIFAKQSTMILFRVIVGAVAQIANYDRIGQFSASNIVDGTIKLEIAGFASAALIAKDGKLTFSERVPRNIMSYMQFADVKTARDLFDGRINSVTAVGEGNVRIGGMISQIDNVNRILSRVELYLR